MSDKLITSIVSVMLAIAGVTIIALLVSKSAQTSGVLTATGGGFVDALKCALSPVLGAGSCGTATSSNITFS